MSPSCQVSKSQRPGDPVFLAEFQLPLIKRRRTLLTMERNSRDQITQVLAQVPRAGLCLLLFCPYSSILNTQSPHRSKWYKEQGRSCYWGLLNEAFMSVLFHGIWTSCYLKQTTLSWLFYSFLFAWAIPCPDPFVGNRIQSSPLDSQFGRIVLLCYGPDLVIGKNCLASFPQLCWDLDGKSNISPHGILLWLRCRIMVQSSNMPVLTYSAGSPLGHKGSCTT